MAFTRAVIALAFVAVVSADAGSCTDAGCADEEPSAVSLLQTELRVDHAPKISKPAATPAAWSTSLRTADGVCAAFAVVLLIVAAALTKNCESSSRAKCVAEFIGTFALIISVGCNVLVGDKTWGVTSIAATLMVSIYALGGISGANFNPAVSVALGLSNKLPWAQVAIYICVQLSAGLFAGLSYGLILGDSFKLGPSTGHTMMAAGFAELLYTFMLCFVVLNTAASKEHGGKDQFYGLAIGFVIVAGGYGAGSISGGAFNPAVALGIDSSSSSTFAHFGNCMIYWIFELVGAALAAGLFRVCRPEDFDGVKGIGTKLVSEFLGTYMLVLTVGLNVVGESKAGAFSIASALMCMIFALGSVSGAHFNPAVTTAIACSGRECISAVEAIQYIGVQLLGGISAAFTYALLMNNKTCALAPKSHGTVPALAGEFFFTFLLSYVVLSVATVKDVPTSQYFGLAIGGCVIAGGFASGNLSGGSLNPAVSAGLAVSDFAMNSGPIEHFFTYTAVELLGGIVAASIFHVTHDKEYTKA